MHATRGGPAVPASRWWEPITRLAFSAALGHHCCTLEFASARPCVKARKKRLVSHSLVGLYEGVLGQATAQIEVQAKPMNHSPFYQFRAHVKSCRLSIRRLTEHE
jgi:hypothetical protein